MMAVKERERVSGGKVGSSVVATMRTDVADVGEDTAEIGLVLAFARANGYECADFEDACRGWLRGVAGFDGRVTASGRRRARAVVRFLAGLLSGERYGAALAASGLTWMQVTRFRFASKELRDLLDKADAELKRQIGRRVVDAAAEAAIEGVDKAIYFKGEKVGVEKVRDNNLLAKMLPLSGSEFRNRADAARPDVGVKVVWNILAANGQPAKLLEREGVIDV